jgi:hypothetical protein
MSSTPTYKTEDNSLITFRTSGPLYQAILTSPTGIIIEGRESFAIPFDALVQEIVLTYTGGIPMSYMLASSPSISPASSLLSSNNVPTAAEPFYDGESGTFISNIPRIIIPDAVDPVPETTSQINQKLSLNQDPGIISSLTSKLPVEVKLTNSINTSKENIKKTLIPFILNLLKQFGPVIVQSLSKKIPFDRLVELASCSRVKSGNFYTLLNKRNNLVRQINNIYETIKSLTTASITLNTLIQSINVGINIVLLNPYPVPASVPDNVNKLKKQLEKYSVVINIITITLSSFGLLLGVILRLLTLLDAIMEKCAQNNDMPRDTINSDLMGFVNTSTGINNSEVVAANKEYKDFKLELKIDDTNTSSYPKQYAQALNKQGVPVLKTDSSFTSDPQTLINELKFIIDLNPNLTAE